MTNDLRDKVIAAFKGFIRTYKLLSRKKRKSIEISEYVRSGQWFTSESDPGLLELLYRRQNYDRLIDLVDRLFPGQTDRRFVSRCLKQAAREWIEEGHNPDDQTLLEQTATGFLKKVEGAIESFVVYVPVEGLKFGGKHLELARCQLYPNQRDSELMQAIHRERKALSAESEEYDGDYSTVEQAPAFFRVNVSGHQMRAIQRSKEEGDLALNVLRLFVGSFYMDIHTQPSRPRYMGVVGTLPAIGAHGNVFWVCFK